MTAPTYEATKKGYANLWATARLRPEHRAEAEQVARSLARNRQRYAAVAAVVGCPWWWVACVHQRESSANFKTHLHNGDPLSAKTVRVPAGRPPSGSPPFDWEESAVDALVALEHLDRVPSWEVERCLYQWERYNGWGYLGKTDSPYVWSFTDRYASGKYVADHEYDPKAVDKQIGCAAILRAMLDLGLAELRGDDDMAELKTAVQAFSGVAPLLAQTILGPMAPLGVKVLSEALGAEGNGADQVARKMDEASAGDLLSGLKAAEALITQLLVPAGPVPVPVTDVVPASPIASSPPPGKVDQALGGSMLTGWKTYIGLAIYGAAYVAGALGYVPPDVATAVEGLGGTIAGVGAVAKVERYLSWGVSLLGGKTT